MKSCCHIVKIMAKLTDKQQAFVLEYIKDKNATRAAKAAGYSESTAYSQGQRLLKNVEVAAAIKAALGTVADTCKMDAAMWLQDVMNIKTMATQDGNMKDALKALDMIGKYLGIYTEKNETTLTGGLEITWLQ